MEPRFLDVTDGFACFAFTGALHSTSRLNPVYIEQGSTLKYCTNSCRLLHHGHTPASTADVSTVLSPKKYTGPDKPFSWELPHRGVVKGMGILTGSKLLDQPFPGESFCWGISGCSSPRTRLSTCRD